MKKNLVNFPTPGCRYGYTRHQVEMMFGVFTPKFDAWMEGQTICLCDGKECLENG